MIEVDSGQQINITLFNFFDTQEFSHKSNSSQISNSEIQPPVFSYSPNYQDIQGLSSFHASVNSKDRLLRRALVKVRNMEEGKVDDEEEEEEQEEDSRSFDTKSHQDNLTRSSPKSKPNPAKGKTNIEENSSANHHHPQTLAQVGLFQHNKPSTNHHHHHLHKARICIEVAYAKELQADKVSVNSRSKRNVTKEGVRPSGDDHCDRTIETRSPGYCADGNNVDASNISPRRQTKRRRRGVDRKSISICEDDPRMVHVFLSKGSKIGVELRNQPQLMRGRQGTFMLKFEGQVFFLFFNCCCCCCCC